MGRLLAVGDRPRYLELEATNPRGTGGRWGKMPDQIHCMVAVTVHGVQVSREERGSHPGAQLEYEARLIAEAKGEVRSWPSRALPKIVMYCT